MPFRFSDASKSKRWRPHAVSAQHPPACVAGGTGPAATALPQLATSNLSRGPVRNTRPIEPYQPRVPAERSR